MSRALPALLLLTLSAPAGAAGADAASLYELITDGTSARLKAGDPGTLVIQFKLKSGAHVSDEAPLKIELSSPGLALSRERLTLADSANPKKPGETSFPEPRFVVPFTPKAPGSTSVEAKMTFFICTEKLCARQQKSLSIPVEVM
jgi:hypothetical protein